MSKHLRIFLAGALTIIPFLAVLYVVIWGAGWLGALGYGLIRPAVGLQLDEAPRAVKIMVAVGGAALILLLIYLLGLLMHFLAFRRLVDFAERTFQRVPGIRTIYDSVRDLLGLFGSHSGKMGKVVMYHPQGQEMAVMGILTNAKPAGLKDYGEHDMVAIYVPMAFMIGGPLVYVPRKHLREIDMSVEQALKLCATAEISPGFAEAAPGKPGGPLVLPPEIQGSAAAKQT